MTHVWALAEGQRQKRVRLLAIVIRSHGVHPQDHLVAELILVCVLVCIGHSQQEEPRPERLCNHGVDVSELLQVQFPQPSLFPGSGTD